MEALKDNGLTILAGPRSYALSAWQPLHGDCEDFSSEDLVEW